MAIVLGDAFRKEGPTEERTLIGDEWVSLSRCSKLDPRYLKIWHSIQSEPTYESWFGGRNAEKGQFTDTFGQ